MKKLTEVFKEEGCTYSFELFPPKTEKGYQNLLETIRHLCDLNPDFISVTYGAGGGNRERTIDIADHIQKDYKTLSVAHLTCVLSTKNEIKDMLGEIKNRGVSNVLALRGDPPQNQPDWEPTEENFKYSCELCAFMRSNYGDYFSIGVAGFPEGHTLAPDKETDAKYLKAKIDAGADYVITQLFFDNKDYFEYVKRLRKLGITKRIIPGILPITDYNNIVKFCKICGATVTKKVHDIFGPIKNDKEATLKEGIKFTIKQCSGLLDGGAPGIHFYSLNKLEPVATILKELQK